ncbi:hypothetical protein L0Z72_16520 [candidate division KSB1 bacterium]|nr:hypothetical protein [candidate division KSB1 bacterium]
MQEIVNEHAENHPGASAKTIDEIWALDAEKRLQAFKEGRLKTLTYNEVFEN